MKNKAIDIILRVRPHKQEYKQLKIDDEDKKFHIFIPKDQGSGYVNNTQEHFSFKFNDILDQKTSQATVFNRVAKDVCDSALEGFNGTIFAYGQTGSGKTFTMTGGERYQDRGMIPRTISYLFSETAKKTDTIYNMFISYIEIYGGTGYDLLDEKHNNTKLEDLPKVQPRETEDEDLILHGLSLNKVEKEEDALNLLFIGDNHRVVCETPKNDASTRSHCIFIIIIEARKPDSDVKTVSRIHLVDLSGSERIGKTGVDGKLQTEATGINLSLHFLEHVIVCLNKKANGENIHVPYRNSLMTMVLRNSLGGNCRTRMVATASPQFEDLDESISTCKFAQRVAMIKNTVERNESVDPGVIISRLKRENAQLKAELALLKGENVRENLDPEEIDKCREMVKEFIQNRDPSASIILSDRLKINECFYYFKHLYHDLAKKGGQGGANKMGGSPAKGESEKQQSGEQQQDGKGSLAQFDEIKRLKLLVQQRDNEILILLNLINKNKSQGQEMTVPVQREEQKQNEEIMKESMIKSTQPLVFKEQEQFQRHEQKEKQQSIASSIEQNNQSTRIGSDLTNVTMPKRESQSGISENENSLLGSSKMQALQQQQNEMNKMLLFPLNLTNDQLMDRANCFELFRKSYRKNEVMEENKEILKQKYANARQLGAIVTNARNKIKILKNQIEDLRKEQALDVLAERSTEEQHPEEQKLIKEIEKLKKVYKDNFDELKEMKQEIERIQLILEKSKEKLQKDFQNWLELMVKQKQQMVGQQQKQEMSGSNNPSFVSNSSKPQQQQQQQQMMGMKTLQPNNYFMENPSIKSNNPSYKSSVSKNMTSQIKDKEVEKNLEAFMKARDKIYQQ